ncbi:MAG: hypothetical protein KYX69_19745 [Sphingomonas sp.]|uniref:hypothetical protein n=1 Tax=Sphingomonas sp. TaxID=28214 RepID=UPI00261B8366|nr:hypothetical protein [Sphingomonas sp.]MDK2769938.1 hypothetical protein [Sphingomonas sp.]
MGGPVEARRPATIAEQADFIDYIVSHCTSRDGTIAASTMHLFTADDVQELQFIASRLHRMAPFEDRIRKIVTQR